MSMEEINATYARWLLSMATPNGECLECHYKSRSNGYACLREIGKAHRFIYSSLKGPIGDFWVLHKCDNRPCINPDHLFLGTPTDNANDMMQKGRHVRAPTFKLTPQQVEEARLLRQQGWIHRKIGERYGVSESTIRNYLTGVSKHASTVG